MSAALLFRYGHSDDVVVDSEAIGDGATPLIHIRPWSRWFPIQVPVTVPNALELHRRRMAIGHSDIDRARQLLALVRLRLLHFSSVIAIMNGAETAMPDT